MERAKEFGEKYNVNYYKTIKELFEKEDFDAAFHLHTNFNSFRNSLRIDPEKETCFCRKTDDVSFGRW